MENEKQLNEVLQTFLKNLNNKSNSIETITALEAKNATLRQEKFELLTKINELLTVNPRQVALTKCLTSQLNARKQASAEALQAISNRVKESSQRASEHIKLYKERLSQTDSSINLRRDNLLEKIDEIAAKTEKNLQRSANLSKELQIQNQQLTELKKFSDSLKQMKDEQKKQLKKVTNKNKL